MLLDLMEEHTGVVILTTNLKKNIDAAFMRRIAYKIEFAFPTAELRERIWRVTLPAEHVDPDVDLVALAKAVEIAGGGIKNAVLRAAYRAASAGRRINMADLIDCAELEYQATGRLLYSPSSVKTKIGGM